MQIVRFGEKLNTPLTLALGYFETMHLGHKALIDTAKQAASNNGSKVGLFTFDRKGATEVYSFDERMDLYRECCDNYVIGHRLRNCRNIRQGVCFHKRRGFFA